jgi:ribonuclease HI
MICYTDGACRANGKDNAAGGFGVVVLDDNQNIVDLYSKHCEGTTNNREELKAILYVMLKYGKKEYNSYGEILPVLWQK